MSQAKDLVEAAPCVVKENVKREEAEKIQATLKAIGAEVVIE